jgi:hypothetical protein
MQSVELEKDKTARISGANHYALRIMSAKTGRSVKDLINQAVALLAAENPKVTR